MKSYQITEWCHESFKIQAESGGNYIDATMGNGNDTLFLCRMAGESGHVTAFDIQQQALEATGRLLKENGVRERAELVLDSHTNMGLYLQEGTVDGIFFNFGYLPGGDHTLATQSENSLRAILSGLGLLKKGGVMSLCIYSGGDTGFEERDKILEMLRNLDNKKYVIILSTYYNRENNPPIPVLVIKK